MKFSRLDLSLLGVATARAGEGVLLYPEIAEQRIWLSSRHHHRCTTNRAGDAGLDCPSFEGGNPCLQFSHTAGKREQRPPAGDGLQELEHV